MRVRFARTEEETNELLEKGWQILQILPGPLIVLKMDERPESIDGIISKVNWKKFKDGSGEWAYTKDREGKPVPEVQRLIELMGKGGMMNGMKYTLEKDGKYIVRRKA